MRVILITVVVSDRRQKREEFKGIVADFSSNVCAESLVPVIARTVLSRPL
jgi:hypothetical protein